MRAILAIVALPVPVVTHVVDRDADGGQGAHRAAEARAGIADFLGTSTEQEETGP